MIKKYVVTMNSIRVVEVLRETDKCVWIPTPSSYYRGKNERRVSKWSDYEKYFDTWQDAHRYLVSVAAADADAATKAASSAEAKLQEILAMTPPEDES